MADFLVMEQGAGAPVTWRPDAARVIHGDPEFQAWPVDKADRGVSAGIWQATPGKWRFQSTVWEYCRILSGISIITEEGAEPRTVRAGDSFVLRAGFKGTWEVIETTRKDYVVRD